MAETSPKAKPSREYQIGERLPLPKPKLDIRPTAPIDNRSSFKPVRKPDRF